MCEYFCIALSLDFTYALSCSVSFFPQLSSVVVVVFDFIFVDIHFNYDLIWFIYLLFIFIFRSYNQHIISILVTNRFVKSPLFDRDEFRPSQYIQI